MVPTLIICITTFALVTLSIIFFPVVKIGRLRLGTYWLIALVGAIVLTAFSFAPIDVTFRELTADSSINPLKILALFFSMTILSVYLDEVGLFRYLACAATKGAKGSQIGLFFLFYGLTSALTIFTSNDVVILTLTPFICFFAKHVKINPLPYLIAEFAAANTWSMMFIIGNPTNIYLATSAHIDFVGYFRVMLLPTLLAGFVEIGLIFLLFRKQLLVPLSPSEEHQEIESKPDLILGVVLLGACLIVMVLSSYIGFEMWWVSVSAAVLLALGALILRLITHAHWEYLKDSLSRLPYSLVPFMLSMFVIVVALRQQGIAAEIGAFLNSGSPVWVYGFSSFLACNLINNIPMSILFSTLPSGLGEMDFARAIYASVIGSNIGAFLTPIGALAGIMFSSLLHKYEVQYSFLDFVKYGFIVAVPTISAALLGLFLVL